MFALSKKDTPAHWLGLYYAAWVNLGIGVLNGVIGNYIMAFVSIGVCITCLVIIKRQTQKAIWEKLTRPSNSGIDWDNDQFGGNSAGP